MSKEYLVNECRTHIMTTTHLLKVCCLGFIIYRIVDFIDTRQWMHDDTVFFHHTGMFGCKDELIFDCFIDMHFIRWKPLFLDSCHVDNVNLSKSRNKFAPLFYTSYFWSQIFDKFLW